MVLSLRVDMVDSKGTQSGEVIDFLNQLRRYETRNQRVLTTLEIQELEWEHKELVMNYFVYHQQSTTIAEYESSFFELKRWAETWSEENFDEHWVVDRFVTGLKEEIRSNVERSYPRSLNQAINLAKWQEMYPAHKVSDKIIEPEFGKTRQPSNQGIDDNQQTGDPIVLQIHTSLRSSAHEALGTELFGRIQNTQEADFVIKNVPDLNCNFVPINQNLRIDGVAFAGELNGDDQLYKFVEQNDYNIELKPKPPDGNLSREVDESCAQLITKLGELDITEDSELCSLMESLTIFWEDFTCLDVSQCMLKKTILYVAVTYLDLGISRCSGQCLALGTKASIWCGKHLKMTLMSTEESQEEEHCSHFFQLLLNLLSFSSASFSALARCPVSSSKGVMATVENFIVEQLNLTKECLSKIKKIDAFGSEVPKVVQEVLDDVIRVCRVYFNYVNWDLYATRSEEASDYMDRKEFDSANQITNVTKITVQKWYEVGILASNDGGNLVSVLNLSWKDVIALFQFGKVALALRVKFIFSLPLIPSDYVYIFAFVIFSAFGCFGYWLRVFDEITKRNEYSWKFELKEDGLYWGERGKTEITEFSFKTHVVAIKLYNQISRSTQKGEFCSSLATRWFKSHGNSRLDTSAIDKNFEILIGWLLEPLEQGDCPSVMQALLKNGFSIYCEVEKILMQIHDDEAFVLYDKLFSYACPKYTALFASIYEKPFENCKLDSYKLQLKLFPYEMKQKQLLNVVHNFLKVYLTNSLGKLATYMEVDEFTLRAIRMTYKHKIHVDSDGNVISTMKLGTSFLLDYWFWTGNLSASSACEVIIKNSGQIIIETSFTKHMPLSWLQQYVGSNCLLGCDYEQVAAYKFLGFSFDPGGVTLPTIIGECRDYLQFLLEDKVVVNRWGNGTELIETKLVVVVMEKKNLLGTIITLCGSAENEMNMHRGKFDSSHSASWSTEFVISKISKVKKEIKCWLVVDWIEDLGIVVAIIQGSGALLENSGTTNFNVHDVTGKLFTVVISIDGTGKGTNACMWRSNLNTMSKM